MTTLFLALNNKLCFFYPFDILIKLYIGPNTILGCEYPNVRISFTLIHFTGFFNFLHKCMYPLTDFDELCIALLLYDYCFIPLKFTIFWAHFINADYSNRAV
jgi:hypothetical protein